MKNFNISRISFTDLFWNVIFSHGSFILDRVKGDILDKHKQFEALRESSDYNTGSISLSAGVTLALLTNYFKPRVIAEVGTFIGRSTYALALGASSCGDSPPIIHTCDFSNDIKINIDSVLCSAIQYPRQNSTDMFMSILGKGELPGMYVLDGRLQEKDLALLAKLQANNAIFILDDFEGTEKGVANTFALTNHFKNNFLLAYPPSKAFLLTHGLIDHSTTAVMIPAHRVTFVNQG